MILNKEHPREELERQSVLDELLAVLLDADFEGGFSMLIIAYRDKLLGYASTRFKQCDAEEIVQSVWMKAWETLQTYESTRIRTMKLYNWLHTMVHNQAINVLKHNSVLKGVFSLDTPEGKACAENHLCSQSPLLEDEVLRKEELRDLSLCIAQLPDMYYTVIKLYYYTNLSYPEIAQILNKPLNTVKSTGLRATKLLRLKMQKINKDEE